MIYKVFEIQENKKIPSAILINIKKTFDHISQVKLVERIVDFGIDNNLLSWTQYFLSDKLVEFVIDDL